MVTEKLGNLFRVRSGDGISVANLSSFGLYPVYGGNGINGYTSDYNVEEGTMIIGRVGEKCGNVNITDTKSWVSDNALIVTPKVKYHIRYLRYLLEQIKLNDYANRNAQPVISGQIIYAIEAPYVENREQQKVITYALQTFDTYIDNLAELIEKKRAIREGVLEDLMSGRTRLKGFVDDWQNEKLLNHVRLVQGLTYTPEDVSISGTLVLRSSNIQNKRLSLEDNVYVRTSVPHEKMICAGDILICVRNGSADLIGKNCVLPNMINTTFGAFMSVLRGDTTGFIAKVFDSSIVQEQVRSRTSATINQITKKDFESIMIPWPAEDEQKAIASVLTTMDEEIEALETERDKMIQIREGTMDDLLTGRVRLSV